MEFHYVLNLLQRELDQKYTDSHFCLRADTHAVISKEAYELQEAIKLLKTKPTSDTILDKVKVKYHTENNKIIIDLFVG